MSNQPRVSTSINRDLTARENEKRVIRILEEETSGHTPKTLSRILNINVNTIKSILNRLLAKGIVTKENGIYCIVDKYRDSAIFDWKIHNIIMTYSIPGYISKKVLLPFDFGICKYQFEIGEMSQKATFRVACSENPIDISSFYSLYLNFAFLVEEYTGQAPKINEILVSSIEFNKDFVNLRLDGANCITLEGLIEQFKIYEKNKFLRLEHKIKVPFTAEILMEMLNRSSNSIEIYNELYQIKKERREGIKHDKMIISLLKKILIKLEKAFGFSRGERYE